MDFKLINTVALYALGLVVIVLIPSFIDTMNALAIPHQVHLSSWLLWVLWTIYCVTKQLK